MNRAAWKSRHNTIVQKVEIVTTSLPEVSFVLSSVKGIVIIFQLEGKPKYGIVSFGVDGQLGEENSNWRYIGSLGLAKVERGLTLISLVLLRVLVLSTTSAKNPKLDPV
jgi:hypothetical protein